MSDKFAKKLQSSKKVVNALTKFIKLKDTQLLYVKLVHDGNMNPFMNIIKDLNCGSLRQHIPPSMHFYLQMDHEKKEKTKKIYES